MTEPSSRPLRPQADAGAYLGSEDEFAVETMPDGLQRDEVLDTMEDALDVPPADPGPERRVDDGPSPDPASAKSHASDSGALDDAQVQELLYQALETEIGGQLVYEAAIVCAQNDDLREEWGKYLAETRTHETTLRQTFERIGLDAGTDSPGRRVLRFKAAGLVESMERAAKDGGPVAAQLVAAECVVEAETKDHQNWELIGEVAKHLDGEMAAALAEAYAKVEEEEDQHLYHTMGWARELWIESLGMPAVLPPPEEEKKVTTAIGAARAKAGREDMLDEG